MTDAKLDEIAAALGRPLPADYRSFMRTCSVAEWNRYCVHFYRSPRQFIRANQAMPLRAPDSNVIEPDGVGGYRPERPWPTDWIIIGDADSEWYTFVRPDAPGVWQWEHEGRSVRQVAGSFAEYLDDMRERLGPPPVLEYTEHPTLGQMAWNPETRQWSGKLAGLFVTLKPMAEEPAAFLAAVADLALAAVAAEPRVFADAIAAGGWADFLEWTDGDNLGLSADTVQTRMNRPSLSVRSGPTVEYQYQPAEELNFFVFWVDTDGQLAVTDQGWVR